MRTTTVEEAMAFVPNGASLMIGGVMSVGTPDRRGDDLLELYRRYVPESTDVR